MSFEFEFIGARYGSRHNTPSDSLHLYGKLVTGMINKGDPILVPLLAGDQLGQVAQFWDNLHDIGVFAFNEHISAECEEPFCLVISGISDDGHLTCPGIARSRD